MPALRSLRTCTRVLHREVMEVPLHVPSHWQQAGPQSSDAACTKLRHACFGVLKDMY